MMSKQELQCEKTRLQQSRTWKSQGKLVVEIEEKDQVESALH